MNSPSTLAHSILIFDSGIGGISIADEIIQRLPQHPLVYVADNKLYPYGTQSEDALITRAHALFPLLEAKYCPAVIVIACNSASTIMLEEVRKTTSTPVIGVVPAIKPAAKHSQSGHIGLLATKGTIGRQYTHALISQFAPSVNMINIGSDVLVSIAETKSRGGAVDMAALTQELTPLMNAEALDTVILGCTHFPLIAAEIQQVLGSKITLIDSGAAVARRTEAVLSSLPAGTVTPPAPLHHQCIFTANDTHLAPIKPFLQRRGFHHVQTIDI